MLSTPKNALENRSFNYGFAKCSKVVGAGSLFCRTEAKSRPCMRLVSSVSCSRCKCRRLKTERHRNGAPAVQIRPKLLYKCQTINGVIYTPGTR